MSRPVLTRRTAESSWRSLRQAACALFAVFPVPALPFPVPCRNREEIFPVIFTLNARQFVAEFGASICISWFFSQKPAHGVRFFPCFSPDIRAEQGKRPPIGRASAAVNGVGRCGRQGEREAPGGLVGFGSPSCASGESGESQPISPTAPDARRSLPLVLAEQERRDFGNARRLHDGERGGAADGERREADARREQAVQHALAHAGGNSRSDPV